MGGYRSLNLHLIPEKVGRPITPTMRNIVDWDFSWKMLSADVVEATMEVPQGTIKIRWTNIDDHWGVTFVTCPRWEDNHSKGPATTKGVQRWLTFHKIPKTKLEPMK